MVKLKSQLQTIFPRPEDKPDCDEQTQLFIIFNVTTVAMGRKSNW